MKKIISLFQRDYSNNAVMTDKLTPGAEWVIAGEGRATRKHDGTAVMIRDGRFYKRYDAKNGKTPPLGWEPCEESPNEHTGHWPGWLPVGPGPEDKHHREFFDRATSIGSVLDGTYELCGPKFQANPEKLTETDAIPHGSITLNDVPTDFVGLRAYLEANVMEGIVWHHPDGRMVKIKARDLGVKWPR